VGLWLDRLLTLRSPEAGVGRKDLPALAGVVLSGGTAGPILMLIGLSRVSALSGALHGAPQEPCARGVVQGGPL
jgi:hypothetical protein